MSSRENIYKKHWVGRVTLNTYIFFFGLIHIVFLGLREESSRGLSKSPSLRGDFYKPKELSTEVPKKMWISLLVRTFTQLKNLIQASN